MWYYIFNTDMKCLDGSNYELYYNFNLLKFKK